MTLYLSHFFYTVNGGFMTVYIDGVLFLNFYLDFLLLLTVVVILKRNVKILNASRRQRIAKGSGTQVQDINKFINSFEMTQKMIKKMKTDKGSMKKMMKGMGLDNLKGGEFKW